MYTHVHIHNSLDNGTGCTFRFGHLFVRFDEPELPGDGDAYALLNTTDTYFHHQHWHILDSQLNSFICQLFCINFRFRFQWFCINFRFRF